MKKIILALLYIIPIMWGNLAYASSASVQNWMLGDLYAGPRSERIAMTFTATSTFVANTFSFLACSGTSTQSIYFDIYRGTDPDPTARTFVGQTDTATVTTICGGPATTTVSLLSPLTVNTGETIAFVSNSTGGYGNDALKIWRRIPPAVVQADYVIYSYGLHSAGWDNSTTIDFWNSLFSVNGDAPQDSVTRIISFTPENGTTTSNPVSFTMNAYIAPEDVGDFLGVEIRLHNIDQNVILASFFSPSDIVLLDENYHTDGYKSFATTSILGEGNYRIEVRLRKNFLGFSTEPAIYDSHQFIVGTSTFIGSMTQTIFNEVNGHFASTTATSSEALSRTCNPISGYFDTRDCMAFLFIPDSASISNTVQQFKSAVLAHAPWGYFMRFYAIVSSEEQASLPSFTASIRTGASTTTDTTTLTFDVGDMLAGGATLLESIKDPYYGKSPRDIFEPLVRLTIALLVIFFVILDLTGGKHEDGYANGRGEYYKNGRWQ